MKVKLICALLALVILTAACAAQPGTAGQRDPSVRVPAGHYSLHFRPVEIAKVIFIPITGVTDTQSAAMGDALLRIRPRFGRSLSRRGEGITIPLFEQ